MTQPPTDEKKKKVRFSFDAIYPKVCGEPPSSVCCFHIMHIRTATYWVAYGEMLWITTQLSYWAAQMVVGISTALLIMGFLFVTVQIALVYALCKGTKNYDLYLIKMYMYALLVRIFIYLLFLLIALYVHILDSQSELLAPFRTLIRLKAPFAICNILLKAYAFHVTWRCYMFLFRTAENVLAEPEEKELNACGTGEGTKKSNGTSVGEFHEMRESSQLATTSSHHLLCLYSGSDC